MKVSIIIPAYNEEKNIDKVLSVVTKVVEPQKIIVVNDGSTDNTLKVAQSYPVKVINLTNNQGKGGAMMAGVNYTNDDYVLFLDADLIGLTNEHIELLIKTVQDEYIDMVVGIFESGRKSTDLAQVVAPFLSGQRLIKKEHLYNIENLNTARFGVEVALTKYAHKNNLKVKEIVLKNLTHVMKEEKLGFTRGFAYRLKMYWEIAKKVTH
ncbi:Glycosyl transferase family 2 [Desulfonispora thiosulfatigenes DSM 11270]|uniref:Glucosyl-3-phosphoglycerate synthase n=1 Tax=Desulfonispora thiosulfatigenes DSM 11270 TaxID=656914 RepID=A0A1W1VM63_DESTI|nr:glycosyltransferase family 2 protein [Desulfonispora thiosulfatigenes]SMB94044.1 Glycosyl transferase family 2 [Desulfonispora thiosulfatigenes DSM 11270]